VDIIFKFKKIVRVRAELGEPIEARTLVYFKVRTCLLPVLLPVAFDIAQGCASIADSNAPDSSGLSRQQIR